MAMYLSLLVFLAAATFPARVTTTVAAEALLFSYQDIEYEVNQLEEQYINLRTTGTEMRSMVNELLTDLPDWRGDQRQRRNAPNGFLVGPPCYYGTCEERRTMLVPGEPGDRGMRGPMGVSGERGPKGDPGDPGPQGLHGENGLGGEKGDTGDPGEGGIDGLNGRKGIKGSAGLKGNRGPKGSYGRSQSSTPTTVYTRWGSCECPVTSTLVYEGFAAGSNYDQTGGGANYVCLPRNPVYRRPEHGVSASRAYMYGAEYEVVNFPPFSGKDDGDVPCAVCSATNRTVTLMQPARTECPSGWTREYYGYLMAQSYDYYRSEWTCVDHSATLTDPSCTANSDGALFYPTEVICGNSRTGLPCELYTDGYELTCSVCAR